MDRTVEDVNDNWVPKEKDLEAIRELLSVAPDVNPHPPRSITPPPGERQEILGDEMPPNVMPNDEDKDEYKPDPNRIVN